MPSFLFLHRKYFCFIPFLYSSSFHFNITIYLFLFFFISSACHSASDFISCLSTSVLSTDFFFQEYYKGVIFKESFLYLNMFLSPFISQGQIGWLHDYYIKLKLCKILSISLALSIASDILVDDLFFSEWVFLKDSWYWKELPILYRCCFLSAALGYVAVWLCPQCCGLKCGEPFNLHVQGSFNWLGFWLLSSINFLSFLFSNKLSSFISFCHLSLHSQGTSEFYPPNPKSCSPLF